jgi:hypothetical protein
VVGQATIQTLTIGLGSGSVATNTALGLNCLLANTTGSANTAIGYATLQGITNGQANTAIGFSSLNLSNGTGNTTIGTSTFRHLTTGDLNVAIGQDSGRYIADGVTQLTTSQNSVFLGMSSRPLANSQTNQIVIGYNAIGAGSNSVVLGNDSITTTLLKGNVGIGTSSPSVPLEVNGGVKIYNLGGTLANSFTFGVSSGLPAILYNNGSYMIRASSDASEVYIQGTNYAVLKTSSQELVMAPSSFTYLNVGNFAIGTSTNAGYKLDVNGTFRTTVSTETNPFVVAHTNGNYASIIIGNGTQFAPGQFGMHFNGSGVWSWSGSMFRIHGGILGSNSNAITFQLIGGYGGNTVGTSIKLGSNTYNQGQFTATSGTQNTVEIGTTNNEIWAPTSGNATYSLLNLFPRINTTGTYAGIVRGFYYAPTLTSVTGVTHRAIETTAGNVIFNGGSLGVGTSTPSYTIDVNGTGRVNRVGNLNHETVFIVSNTDSNSVNFGYNFKTYSDGSNRYLEFDGFNTTGKSFMGDWVFASGRPVVTSGIINNYWNNFDIIQELANPGQGIRFLSKSFSNSVPILTILQSGNVLLGTTTDAGYKFDVIGSTRLKGIGNTVATIGLIVQNSAGNSSVTCYDDLSVYIDGKNSSGYATNIRIGGLSNTANISFFGNNNIYVGQAGSVENIPSALIAMGSTTKGFLPPRMTTTEKNAIATPAAGLMIYDTTLNRPCFYNGTSWITL